MSDAWSINLMRKLLIDTARTPEERAWAEAIPWQKLPTSDVVATLIRGQNELELQNKGGLELMREKSMANERLFLDAERLRAENKDLREANERLFMDNGDLHRELGRLRSENERLLRLLHEYN